MRDNILMEELSNTCAATLFLPSLCSMLLKIGYFFSRHVQFYFLLHVLHLEKYGPIGKNYYIKRTMLSLLQILYVMIKKCDIKRNDQSSVIRKEISRSAS